MVDRQERNRWEGGKPFCAGAWRILILCTVGKRFEPESWCPTVPEPWAGNGWIHIRHGWRERGKLGRFWWTLGAESLWEASRPSSLYYRNPSGLFGAAFSFAEKPVGTAKNSTQSGLGAASWSAPGGGSNNPPVAPQPQGFMFGSGPPPARANSSPLNPAVAPQPPGFVFGSGPSPAGANSPPPYTKNNSPRSSAF